MSSISITRQYLTVDGSAVSDHRDAFELARAIALSAGFSIVGASNQTRSTYLARAGFDRRLRIADHSNGRYGADELGDVQARLTSARTEIVTTMDFEDEDGETITEEATEWMTVVAMTPEMIGAVMRRAIAGYDAHALPHSIAA
jgi:hypothetical protein